MQRYYRDDHGRKLPNYKIGLCDSETAKNEKKSNGQEKKHEQRDKEQPRRGIMA